MFAFILVMLLSGAFLIGGLLFHMSIRSHYRTRTPRRVTRPVHLHDIIFEKEPGDDNMQVFSVE